MDVVLDGFKKAWNTGNGYALAEIISPIPPASNPSRLSNFWKSSNQSRIQKDIETHIFYGNQYSREEGKGWVEVFSAYWEVAGALLNMENSSKANLKDSWTKVYEAWKALALAMIRGYTNSGFEAWTVPCLYVAGKYIRIFAIKADEGVASATGATSDYEEINPEVGQNEKLEDAARVLNRMFQICVNDRSSLDESRQWGIYYIVNLLFKTYFKLNSIALSKNVVKAIHALTADMPPLVAYPKAHRVTFKYYVGVIHFLDEDYVEAEKHLTYAWNYCHRDTTRNRELILTYLIPCHLLTTHTLPTPSLLAPYPRLQKLFLPLSRCIKSGDLSGFDLGLQAGEEEFVKRRIYLTLERGRDIALRNLLRKVFLAGGYEDVKEGEADKPRIRKTRIPVDMFGAAISLGQKEVMDTDEVECLLANMIYKNLMKGYIARERGIVVLSKGGAFPGTGV